MTGFLSCISYTQTHTHTQCLLLNLRSDSYELSSYVTLGMSGINYDEVMTIATRRSPYEDNNHVRFHYKVTSFPGIPIYGNL